MRFPLQQAREPPPPPAAAQDSCHPLQNGSGPSDWSRGGGLGEPSD